MDAHKRLRQTWIWGGFGSLLWLPVVGGGLIAEEFTPAATLAYLGFIVGLAYLFLAAPWRRQRRQIRWLILGMTLIPFLTAMALVPLVLPMLATMPRSNLWLLLLILGPNLYSITLDRKTWTDLAEKPTTAGD